MSQHNVERTKRAFDAFTRGDMEMASSAVQVWEAFGELGWEPREIVDLGDRVLVRVRIMAKG